MDVKLEQSEDRVTQAQLDFFIKGNVSLEKAARASPATWIPAQVTNINYNLEPVKLNTREILVCGAGDFVTESITDMVGFHYEDFDSCNTGHLDSRFSLQQTQKIYLG